MSSGIWSAASGAIGQVTSLDVTAENVANASTSGYRGSRAVFREVLTRAVSKRSGGFDLRYSLAATPALDSTQGSIVVTNRPLDVAIRGEAFMVVKTPQGERYTRSGALKISQDGILRTAGGDEVLSTDKSPLRVPLDQPVSIAPDGTLLSGTVASGQILLVEFKNPGALTKQGHFLLRADDAAGKPSVSAAMFEPGALESSNVSPVQGMVELVNVSRAFEICEKSIEAFRDADRRAAVDLMSLK